MKKISSTLLLCVSVLCIMLASIQVKANRAAAGEIAWTWVSDSTYKLTYTFYKDCAGATAEPASVKLCYYNTCNTDNGSVTLSKTTPLSSNGLTVANTCVGNVSTSCSSPAGIIRGYRAWVYQGTVTLPSRCASWHFVVSINARNTGITNWSAPSPTNNNLYVEATMDNANAPNSSSPTFSLPPIQYLCSGINQSIPYGGVDPNGDVLSYSLVAPSSDVDNQTTCLFPPAPSAYTPVVPTSLPGTPFASTGFTIDGTGLMTFRPTPALAQLAQVGLLVTKTRGTKVIGTVLRDMQFVISNTCSAPVTNFAVNSATSTGVFISAGEAVVCPNVAHTICFNLKSTDKTAQINILGDNHTTFSPTASSSTMSSYYGLGTDSVAACFSWTPDTTDEAKYDPTLPAANPFRPKYLVIKSSICKAGNPLIYRLDTIPIHVNITVHASPDDTICKGEADSVSVIGGYNVKSVFGWYTYPALGTFGIACPSCRLTSVGYPASTTTYLVTDSSLDNSCHRIDYPALTTNQDLTKIIVVNPKIDAGPDTILCTYSTLQLNSNLLNPQPELTYAWKWTAAPWLPYPGNYLDDSTITTPKISFPNPVTRPIPDSLVYVLKCTPSLARCAVVDTITVQILKGFYILTGDSLQKNSTGFGYLGRQKGVSDTAICKGGKVTLNLWRDDRLGDRGYDWVWTPSTGVAPSGDTLYKGMTLTPTATTTYTITAHKNGCPDSSKRINIEVQPVPTVNIGPDRSICFGDTINVFATIVPAPDVYSYSDTSMHWTPGGAFAVADTFYTYFTGYLSQKVAFTVKTTAGCMGTDTAIYTVQPRKFLTVSNDTSICPGDKIKLTVDGGSLLQSFSWFPKINIDTPTSLTPYVWPVATTNYVVTAVDSNRCIDSAIVKVTVLPHAVIYLPDSVTLFPGDIYQMNPESNCLYFSWFPGLGLDYTDIANPKASPATDTRYYITGHTQLGCTVKDSIDVFVAPDSYIDMPNAFVPGHGENGTYSAVHLGNVTLTSFQIYNRWGSKMFETKDINQGWDGTFGGKPQPMGVYVYTIEAVTASGKKIVKQGNLTLIR
jgi:gliding motility-associated-like protein